MHLNCTDDAVSYDTHQAQWTLGINTLWPTNYCFDYRPRPESDVKCDHNHAYKIVNKEIDARFMSNLLKENDSRNSTNIRTNRLNKQTNNRLLNEN